MPQDLTEANLNATAEPTPTVTPSEDVAPDDSSSTDEINDETNYDGIDWDRLKAYQRPYKALERNPSFIYKYGYRLQHRVSKRIYWECAYCHQRSIPGGRFDITTATSASKRHLAENKTGHGYDKHGEITFETKKRKATVLELLHDRHTISQGLANDFIGGFNAKRFKQSVIEWITANNHPLREVETPAFRSMIAAANPDAESCIWKNHQSIRVHIMADYKAYQLAVCDELANARSKLHFSFNGWTTRSESSTT